MSIRLVVDHHSVTIPKAKDVNVKNSHLCNFVLFDDQQNELFQLIQNEHKKRKPDVVVNGVKLHEMSIEIQNQVIPFFYCSQKRITSQSNITLRHENESCASDAASQT